MTGPVTTEALRDALARSAIQAKFGPEGVAVIFDTPDEATDHQRAVLTARAEEALRVADFAIAGPLAPLLAALQQVTAERDEEKSRADRIDAKLGELNAAVRECLPPVEVLVAEREAAEAALATATSELARLRAEGEAIRAALKVFAAMSAMDPPKSVPLNEWLPAITGARAVLNDRTALTGATTTAQEAQGD